jgi:hypothetical protein
MTKKKEKKMLKVSEVADILGKDDSSIRVWLKRGRFPGARLEETPIGSYWLIPADAVENFKLKKAGRPAKKKNTEKPKVN